jgi:glycosyltransferase involved in cell wall biosynthesis
MSCDRGRRRRGQLAYCGTPVMAPDQRVHFFEPTGAGGIFQHACAVAELLVESGRPVTMHVPRQHEPVELRADVELCRCIWWPREMGSHVRRGAVAARLVGEALPHLHRRAGRGSIVHVQGGTASGFLTILTLLTARARGRRLVYSPHNTFTRRGPIDLITWTLALQLAEVAVGYSRTDVARLRSMGPHAFMSPLVQLVPPVSEASIAAWRDRWGATPDRQVVLFAGQIRHDKRLDLLIRSAQSWPAGRILAVAGQDRGAWEGTRRLAADLGVEIASEVGYIDLDAFTAALAAADLVVLPYERASQSGILSISRHLGTPTLAADVGGLEELAHRTFPAGDVDALTAAIDRTLAGTSPEPSGLDEHAALSAHLAAYEAVSADRETVSTRPRTAVVVWGPSAGRAEEIAGALSGEAWRFYDLALVERRAIPLRYALSAARTAARLARRRPRSLVVVNPPVFPALIGLLYSRVTGTPFALDSHPQAFGRKRNALGRRLLWLHRWIARRSAVTLVGAPELKRRVESWGARSLILHEAPPLLPVGPPAPLGSRLRLLWIGIFAWDEPLRAVLEAASRLPDVEFRVTGDVRRIPVDPEEAPPNVVFTGFLRGAAYHEEVRSADAVLAMTVEPTSALRAAAEGIYHQRPLITSDLPHLRELFPSAIFISNDADGIVAGVERLRADVSSLHAAAPAARARLLRIWEQQRAALAAALGHESPRAVTEAAERSRAA